MNINHLVFQPLKNEVLDKKNYLIQSFLLHLCVIFLLYYGFPNIFKYKTEFLPPLPIEIINISNKTAAPKVNFQQNKEKDVKQKDYTTKEDNVKYHAEDKIVIDDPDAIALKKTDLKKIEKKKIIIKVDKIKKKPNQLQSVLKSIEQIKKDISDNKKSKKEIVEKDEKLTPKKLGMTLTISEIDAIRRHFEKCWNIPSGAREAGNLATEIKARFNKEGNVLNARILDINRMKRDVYFRTAAESALRAVLNPRCKNAPLPIDKYDKWKNITLNFDPKSVIGY